MIAEYYGFLRSSARSICRSASQVDDLVHDTVERALRAWDRYQGPPCRRGWLYAIMRNRWRTMLVRESRYVPMVRDVPSPPPASVEAQLTVHQAMLALTTSHREVLECVVIEGMSYGAAANALGVPTGTVMSRVARAKASLAKAIGP